MATPIRVDQNRQKVISGTLSHNGVPLSLTATPYTVVMCVKPHKDQDTTNAAAIILISNGSSAHSSTRTGYTSFTVTAAMNNQTPGKYIVDFTVFSNSLDAIKMGETDYIITNTVYKN